MTILFLIIIDKMHVLINKLKLRFVNNYVELLVRLSVECKV